MCLISVIMRTKLNILGWTEGAPRASKFHPLKENDDVNSEMSEDDCISIFRILICTELNILNV